MRFTSVIARAFIFTPEALIHIYATTSGKPVVDVYDNSGETKHNVNH